ncbi:MAG TPA: hypothetical protein VGG35_05880 [Streptosporangiaceae bacterium]|jgi:hypothetical protein
MDIVVDDGDQFAANSLMRWLSRDREVRGEAAVTMVAHGAADEMGGLEVINVVLTQAASLLNLVLAFEAWRGSRAEHPAITITINKQSVTLVQGTAEEMRRKIQALITTAGDSETGSKVP